PCLLADINRCSAPCVGRITEDDHRQIVKQLTDFMSGDTKKIMRDLADRMEAASAVQDYERASVLRDDLRALESVIQKSAVVFAVDTNADFVAIDFDELQSAVQIFRVRVGRIVGQYGFVMENPVESTPDTLMVDALMHIYEDLPPGDIPPEVFVNHEPQQKGSVEAVISTSREAKVKITVPQRGDKKTLLETVQENARQALVSHKSKRSTDLVSRSQALAEIQQALNLPNALLRIECIDVSHISGTDVVASLVVFEDGLPSRKDYRHFIIEDPRDDTASIHQVVTRRFAKAQNLEASTSRYSASLLVIDGGQPQVNAAARALTELGITDLPVIGLAKRMEEIWLPAAQYPVVLPRTSEGLFMLQRLRDEAHRFAITFHRDKRSKSMTESVLDDITGLGPIKQKALLKKFGSVKRIRQASVMELCEVPGINVTLAETIARKLSATGPEMVVDTTTGEIIEL
ncbi:MAG: excinuclease ABC subunit UvrC, partial [Actinomycetales bacterium]|nr:excinuclease ABC subunit UvrC [Actinomycetales bacterium]